MRACVIAATAAAVFLAGCSATPAAAPKPPGFCYVSLTSGWQVTEYVTVWLATGQSCGQAERMVAREVPVASAEDDGAQKPWLAGSGYTVACTGLLTTAGDDPSTVVAQGGHDTGGVCSALGFSES
jgi:hypothetical protein